MPSLPHRCRELSPDGSQALTAWLFTPERAVFQDATHGGVLEHQARTPSADQAISVR